MTSRGNSDTSDAQSHFRPILHTLLRTGYQVFVGRRRKAEKKMVIALSTIQCKEILLSGPHEEIRVLRRRMTILFHTTAGLILAIAALKYCSIQIVEIAFNIAL